MLKLILALDLLEGKVVARIAEHRYLPVEMIAKCISTSDPVEILSKLNPSRVYLADLDRINSRGQNLESIQKIRSGKWEIWLDLGARSREDLELSSSLSQNPILATQTSSLELIASLHGELDFCLGIDLMGNQVLIQQTRRSISDLRKISGMDWDQVLILDLSRVGTGMGPNLEMISKLDGMLNPRRLLAGGGIRGLEDLDRLEELGVKFALVATGIYRGWIPHWMLRS